MSPPTTGVFVERPVDVHVGRRADLLAADSALPPPAVRGLALRAARFPDDGADALLRELGERGLAVAQLDEPLDNGRFAALGSLLGTAMPETDPAVQPYVDDAVILNLVTEHEATEDVSLQPFAANFLTLHSEGSGRPVAEQPRFIVLMCCQPGASQGARTVLVPMAPVASALAPDQRTVLARTRYRRSDHGPHICRVVDDRPVFSFRDFASQALDWIYAGPCQAATDSVDVNGAIRALLAQMYAPGVAAGLVWRRGMLVIIDNTFFFHGRTASMSATHGRHLKRLRILAQPPTARGTA